MIEPTFRNTTFGIVLMMACASVQCNLCYAQTKAEVVQPSSERDVAILSLRALDDPRAEHRRHLEEKLIGPGQDLEKDLFDFQMEIVRKTADFGPVLLLVPDEETKTAVYRQCNELEICGQFRSGHVRMKVVPHEGVWIRDFGPDITSNEGVPSVIHWRYFDNRAEESKHEQLRQITTLRVKLLEERMEDEDANGLLDVSSVESKEQSDRRLDEMISLTHEYSEILKESSVQRSEDENSAYDVADAVLAKPDFRYASSKLAVDGGNLLRLADGRCLTTRVLLSRNKDEGIEVKRELIEVGHCKDVIFLDPLPGPVIEHVDMFLLPVSAKRLLIASYDISNPYAEEYWRSLSSAERHLAVNAALAMDRDAEKLSNFGYEVVRVPSPFPRIPHGEPYYPTVLNALVRSGEGGRRQVLVPYYHDYEPDVQEAASEQIRAAFGPETELVRVEATEAAKAQGAVHCVTLTVPFSVSIFGDSDDQARRNRYSARKEQLDKEKTAEIAAEIPATGLRGLWAIFEEDEKIDATALDLSPDRIFFGEGDFELGFFRILKMKGSYKVAKKDATSWSLRMDPSDENSMTAVVQWLDRDSVSFRTDDGGTVRILRRLNDDGVSPFVEEGQGDEPALGPARKTPGQTLKKPKVTENSTIPPQGL